MRDRAIATRPADQVPPVIVIDDDLAVRESCTLLLGFHFGDVRDYPSAEAFLSALDAIPLSCLVVDVNMSEMDGLNLLAELAKRGRRMPTVLMTGRHDDLVRQRAAALGASAVLEKPVLPEQLVDAIKQAVAAFE